MSTQYISPIKVNVELTEHDLMMYAHKDNNNIFVMETASMHDYRRINWRYKTGRLYNKVIKHVAQEFISKLKAQGIEEILILRILGSKKAKKVALEIFENSGLKIQHVYDLNPSANK